MTDQQTADQPEIGDPAALAALATALDDTELLDWGPSYNGGAGDPERRPSEAIAEELLRELRRAGYTVTRINPAKGA